MEAVRRTIVLIVVALPALTACARDLDTGEGRPAGQQESLLPKDRLALPEYDIAQYTALLSELQGAPVVVNVWGSWCPPCIEEAPDLAEVSKEFEGRVQFLGIDILDAREAARDFIRQYDWHYPHIFDPGGAIRDGLGYIGQPITLVYDREGELAFEWNGVTNADMLRREIRKVL